MGGSGYTGAELLRLLAGHPEIEVVHVTADSNAGTPVQRLYPSLGPAYPHSSSRRSIPRASTVSISRSSRSRTGSRRRSSRRSAGRVGHIVDLGADFRLPAATYEAWYGKAHDAPELLDAFAYGLPELFRDSITSDVHIAAPGCYPTAAALALAPALAAGLVEPSGIVVNAMSGISGRGRGLSAPSLYSEANESATAYGLLTHRHTGEIEHALDARPRNGRRGALHAAPRADDPGHPRDLLRAPCERDADLRAGARRATRRTTPTSHSCVVTDESPVTKATLGSNACHVTVRYDARTGTVLAIAALDNLVKGAAGQAIQAANLVLGLPEPTGLPLLGLMP